VPSYLLSSEGLLPGLKEAHFLLIWQVAEKTVKKILSHVLQGHKSNHESLSNFHYQFSILVKLAAIKKLSLTGLAYKQQKFISFRF
jgi:hypothetical protein